MKISETYYKGILRCQFSTCKSKELGLNHKTIFSYIALEPTFELYDSELITKKEYDLFTSKYILGSHIKSVSKDQVVDYYNAKDALNGKRMHAEEIFMGLEAEPTVIDDKFWNWEELFFAEIPKKYLHECFITYHPNANHGRISGPIVLKRIQKFDEKGREIFTKEDTYGFGQDPNPPIKGDRRQGCSKNLGGIASFFYGINQGIKNKVNSRFGNVFGSNLIGNEPNGCMPSLLPSGCSGAGCQRFGCGILSLLAAIALLLWLFRCLLFGDCGNSGGVKERVVERIVHDTVYIDKNAKVDTVTYVDETTNTTVKMVSLPNVQFEKNKSILLRSSIPQLNELAAYLNENEKIEAEIFGHTDSDGDAKSNRILSQNRAEAVRQYLIKNGVNGNRIKATGMGESQPVTENLTAEGRAMNRRVEVKLSQISSTKTTRKEDKRKL